MFEGSKLLIGAVEKVVAGEQFQLVEDTLNLLETVRVENASFENRFEDFSSELFWGEFVVVVLEAHFLLFLFFVTLVEGTICEK